MFSLGSPLRKLKLQLAPLLVLTRVLGKGSTIGVSPTQEQRIIRNHTPSFRQVLSNLLCT